MQLESTAFDDGDRIPDLYTCDGDDASPPLLLSDVPADAESVVLIMDDPDAPGRIWVHWLIWNLPPDLEELPEGVPADDLVPDLEGAVQGENDFGNIGWGGPCPPPGHGVHGYRFMAYALDTKLDLEPGATREELDHAMADHILSEVMLTGTYSR